MLNEKQMVARIRDGDRAAFEQFLDAYGGRVRGLVSRYADNPADGEDLTQEIFLDLYRSIGAFRGDAALATWVYRVALNGCFRYRKRLDTRAVPQETIGVEAIDADPRSDPECMAIRGELQDEVQRALSALPRAQYDVVVLCELQGLTYNECARTLDVPVGTVKSRLFTAFRRLRGILCARVECECVAAGSNPATEVSR